jgi:hypothetical protein
MGGVPKAKQVLNPNKLMKSKQIAAFISRRSKSGLSRTEITKAH